MTRLIDADALLGALKDNGTYLLPDGADESEYIYYSEAVDLITNAPTVQRKGWVSVEDILKVEFEKVAKKYKLNLSPSKIEEGNYESARTNEYWWFYKDVLQNLPSSPTDKG